MNNDWKRLDQYCRSLLPELVTLLLIAQRHGKAPAAADLKLSGQALGQRVATAEALLEGPLLEKRSRKGVLTPLGARVLTLAEAVLQELDEFLTDTDHIKNSQDIRIASITSVWAAEKTLLEKAYKMRIPEGSLIPAHGGDDSRSIQDEVVEGRADVGIVSYPPKTVASGLMIRHWRDEPLVFVVSSRRKLMRPVEVALPSDLEQHHTFLTLSANHPMSTMLAEYLGRHRVRFSHKLSFPSIAGVKEAVRNDDGVSILPEPTVREDRREGRLKTIPLRHGLSRPVAVIYRAESFSRESVRAFLDCLDVLKNTNQL
jgi:LysR family hydrogen peroxide-inducible transcriptional activator